MAITYNITTNFGAKDDLPSNDPDKTIFGSQFTQEFNAIKSAFQLAAPSASPAFTGTATFNNATVNGVLTADLIGNISGTATSLETPRLLQLTGDVAGSVSFDGSSDVSISAAIQPNSVVLGTDTTGNYMQNVSAGSGISISHTQGEGSTATITHADTSSQGSINNSGTTFIQDLTFDGFGHVVGASSATVSVGNGTVTLSAGGGLSGSGSFSMNQSNSETITISHANTSSQASSNNSGNRFIQDIYLDTYGHITSLGTAVVDTLSTTEARTAQAQASAFAVGHYAALRAVAGGPFVQNNTYTGNNLAACDFEGYPRLATSTSVLIVGGSWRCHGATRDAGSLTTGAGASRSTLWIRYA